MKPVQFRLSTQILIGAVVGVLLAQLLNYFFPDFGSHMRAFGDTSITTLKTFLGA